MPELPEVQTIVTTLRPGVVGRRIVAIRHLRADMLTPASLNFSEAVTGRTIVQLNRRAKRIVFLLDDGNQFFIHLGMTGRLTVEKHQTPIQAHTHLILDLGSGRELRLRDPRRFGEIRWLGQGSGDEKLGPEPLDMRAAQLAANLHKTTRSIKNALMDQHVIAGLGNIYVDESLFDAAIHPLTRADRLHADQIAKLSRSIKRVLRRAIEHRGSTLRDYVDANGKSGGFQHLHQVYGRAGEPCPNCKSLIKRIIVGGRGTHFCSWCQSKRAQEIIRAGKKNARS